MKLLHAVVRFCTAHARDVSSRGAMTVPHDFRVTVPAPLAKSHAMEPGAPTARQAMALAAANQSRNPATALVAAQH